MFVKMLKSATTTLTFVVIVSSILPAAKSQQFMVTAGIAIIGGNQSITTPATGSQLSIQGQIAFYQQFLDGPVYIVGSVSGLTPGLHGFHVHAEGNLSEGCKSALAHYNPFNQSHGAPYHDQRHVGDLGNVAANNQGVAFLSRTDNQLSLNGPYSIIGRTVIVHALPDDLGQGTNDESKRTGNAGDRLACAIINLAQMRPISPYLLSTGWQRYLF